MQAYNNGLMLWIINYRYSVGVYKYFYENILQDLEHLLLTFLKHLLQTMI